MPSSAFQNRSEEHTSQLQSHDNLGCRLLLENKHTYAEKGAGPHSQTLEQAGATDLQPLHMDVHRDWCFLTLGSEVALSLVVFIFINDTATAEIYTLSLHDALPI